MIDIRAATETDKPQVLELIEEVFGTEEAERAARRWRWHWHQDPRLSHPGYRGVVAEWRGRLIANLTCIPAGLYIAGEAVPACWGVDNLMHFGLTRQALREQQPSGSRASADLSKGLALAMLDHEAAGSIQLGKHVASKMITIGTREGMGFEPIPGSGRWTRRISTTPRMQRGLGKTPGALVGALANLTLPPIPRSGLEVQVLDGPFDARFDGLWERARHEHPAITRRDAALLEWRYRLHPDLEYTVLLVPQGREIRGYAVFSRYVRAGRPRGKLVDLLTLRGDRNAAAALIGTALRRLRRHGVERAEHYACSAELDALLHRFRFEPTPKAYPVMQRGLPTATLYVTDGDGDGA